MDNISFDVNYEIEFPKSISLLYGEEAEFTASIRYDGIIPKEDESGNMISLGIKVFDGSRRIKEYRMQPVNKEKQGKTRKNLYVGKIDTVGLRPKEYRIELNLVIETVRWFGGKWFKGSLQVYNTPAFQDASELIEKYTVEELCNTAETYFIKLRSDPWMVTKPYSVRDISHNFPQVGFLIYGLSMVQGMRVMDFGCGTGWISRTLMRLGMDVVSVDVSKTALEIGEEILTLEPARPGDGKLESLVFDGRRIPVADKTVDRILCNDALHHVPNRAEVICELARVLKPGGMVGFCEPGADHSSKQLSQQEMRDYTVLENDMPLGVIVSEMESAGFSHIEVMVQNALPPKFSARDWLDTKKRERILNRSSYLTKVRSETAQVFFGTKA